MANTVVINLTERYHIAILNFMRAELVPLMREDCQVMFAPSRRHYVDTLTNKTVHGNMLKIPRMALQRISNEPDASRSNLGAIIRERLTTVTGEDEDRPRVGYRVPYPTPRIFTYQITLWAKYSWQAENFEEYMSHKFEANPYQFKVDTGGLFQTKMFSVFLDRLDDESDLEIGEEAAVVRCGADLRCEVWLFRDPETGYLVHEFNIDVHDMSVDDEPVIDTIYIPKQSR